jgi:hypothetical protein
MGEIAKPFGLSLSKPLQPFDKLQGERSGCGLAYASATSCNVCCAGRRIAGADSRPDRRGGAAAALHRNAARTVGRCGPGGQDGQAPAAVFRPAGLPLLQGADADQLHAEGHRGQDGKALPADRLQPVRRPRSDLVRRQGAQRKGVRQVPQGAIHPDAAAARREGQHHRPHQRLLPAAPFLGGAGLFGTAAGRQAVLRRTHEGGAANRRQRDAA